MSRITKIQGTFMGVPFEVKPTPISFAKVEETVRTMLMDWYKENKPELHAKLEDENISMEDFTNQDFLDLNAWKSDVDFRALYAETKANACMKLSKPLKSEIWASDDLEISTIEEAWDFFAGRRIVPTSGV